MHLSVRIGSTALVVASMNGGEFGVGLTVVTAR
jgi:hypothetical protein